MVFSGEREVSQEKYCGSFVINLLQVASTPFIWFILWCCHYLRPYDVSDKFTGEWWIGNYVEEKGRGVTQALRRPLPGECEECHDQFNVDRRYASSYLDVPLLFKQVYSVLIQRSRCCVLWHVTLCNSSYALFRPLVLVGLPVFLFPLYVKLFLYHAEEGSTCLRNLTLYSNLMENFDNFSAVRRLISEHYWTWQWPYCEAVYSTFSSKSFWILKEVNLLSDGNCLHF
jgi:hypothetical protein